MKIYIILLLVLLGAMVKAQTPSSDQNWVIHLNEEFTDSISGIDMNLWQIPNDGWQPNVEYWRNQNIHTNIKNGYVWLEAEDKNINSTPKEYYLGGLKTRSPFEVKYGYYEIKWQLPDGEGRWISFWLCCANTPRYEEIDIFENHHELQNNVMHSNIHSVYSSNPDCGVFPHMKNVVGNDMTLSYNTIGVEWTPKNIIIYYNDSPVEEIFYDDCVPSHPLAHLYITPGITNQESYRVSLGNNINYTKIDYVKVWHLDTSDHNTISVLNSMSSLNSFVFSLKKQIHFDGTQNSLFLTNGQKKSFRAKEEITIEGDFSVPIGAELTLFVHEKPNH